MRTGAARAADKGIRPVHLLVDGAFNIATDSVSAGDDARRAR